MFNRYVIECTHSPTQFHPRYIYVCVYIYLSISITAMPGIILALITEDTLMLHSNYTKCFQFLRPHSSSASASVQPQFSLS